MRTVKVKQEDYVAWYLIFRNHGLRIAWATLPNDPWRDENNRVKYFGFMKEVGQIAISYSFVVGRLKIGTAFHKKEKSNGPRRSEKKS